MPRILTSTLLISIAAHAAVVYALMQPEEQQQVISMGSVKAPISMTFSSVSVPEPQPEPEPEPKPPAEKKPEPEPVKKPEPEQDVVVIPEPIVEQEPEKELPEEEPPEPPVEEQVREEPPMEEQIDRTALEETEVEGLNQEPVFVSEPEIRNWVEPRYPRIAQRRNQQGLVMLEVVVDINGKAMNIQILESSGFDLLDRSAIAAVQDWEFEPQKRNNTLVQSRVHVPVAFQLN